jgi:DUF4097 and DUF4098 domain-containing protein YvlB
MNPLTTTFGNGTLSESRFIFHCGLGGFSLRPSRLRAFNRKGCRGLAKGAKKNVGTLNLHCHPKLPALAMAIAIFVVVMGAMPAQAAVESTFERTLNVNGSVNLEINTGSGNIDVRPGAANEVRVVGHIRASNWFSDDAADKVQRIKANPPIQQSGNDIRIGHIDDPELRRNISISYEVTAPAGTRLHSHSGSGNQEVEGMQGPVEVEAGSGNIKVSDVGGTLRTETGSGTITIDHVKGNVRARAGSGSIRANDVAGGFEGETGSGHVTLEQTASGSVRVGTGSGGIELRGLRGSLEAHAGSGSIEADGDPTGAWALHSGSGGIHLRLASDAAFDLKAHTSSGSLTVNHPITVQGSMGHKEIHGKVRGGGVPVEVETGSGNIEIE